MSIRTIKGFDHNLCCRGKQYEVGKTYEEEGELKICGHGMHAISPDVPPLKVFNYYEPSKDGQRSRYCEVVLDGEVAGDDDKVAALKMTIVRELTMDDLQEWSKRWADEHGENRKAGYRGTATAGDSGVATAGNYGAAMAGYSGVATAGYRGAATAGEYGVATAGYRGAATAGYSGAATAGDSGTATAGEYGTATAGDSGAATAGYRGAATSRGSASVGRQGVAVARNVEARVRGKMGALLVVAIEEDDFYDIKEWKAGIVDGVTLKENTWYTVEDGEWKEVEDGQ